MQTLSIVIPVYNECNTIEEIIKAIEANGIVSLEKEIIIVDDCSKDGTREILKNLKKENLKIIFNNKNSGKGYSVRKGFNEAKGDFIIIQDADLEYSPKEYKILLTPLLNDTADVVYGSRFTGRIILKDYFKAYVMANKFLTILSNLLSGLSLTDMETCYKCFTKDALKRIGPELSAERFDIEPEITAVAAKLKLRIKEVPIDYFRRSYVDGKKIGWKDGLRAIEAIFKFNLFK